ncbi:MAG: thrombospondin type-1 domain-containing protein, partial [Anaerolineaceae bacterium]|nr:thrombospondin type-1 domain-containing protein [Anaerolineaceae bacterium]
MSVTFWLTMRKLTKIAYVMGVVLLVAGMLLSQVSLTVFADDLPPAADETEVEEEFEEEEPEETDLEEELEEDLEFGFGIMSAVGPSGPTDDEQEDVGWVAPGGSACGQAQNCIKAGKDEKDAGDLDQDVSNGGIFEKDNFNILGGTPGVVVIKTGGKAEKKFFYKSDSGVSCDASHHYCVTWNADGSITVTRNTVCETNNDTEKCKDVVKDISHIQFWNVGGSPPPPDPIHCEWGGWSDCSVSCGGGIQTREIAVEAEYDGDACVGESQQACNLQACPVNCVGFWGACEGACGTDNGTQTFEITTPASGDGDVCEATKDASRACTASLCSSPARDDPVALVPAVVFGPVVPVAPLAIPVTGVEPRLAEAAELPVPVTGAEMLIPVTGADF